MNNADIDYKDGLEDGRIEAWECAKKIYKMTAEEVITVFGGCSNWVDYSVDEAIAKIKEYEDKQKHKNIVSRIPRAKIITNGNCLICGKELSKNRLFLCKECEKKQDAEIKVGDEVVIDDKGRKAVVSRVFDNGLYNIVFYNGDTNCVDRRFIAKTGRHFDAISEILAELRGEEE